MNAPSLPLSKKGRHAPRPSLTGFAEQVAAALEQQPGVTARTHWRLGNERLVDGADFYVGQQELGHLHLDGEAHIPLTVALREQLVASGKAHPFPWAEGWVVWPVETPADVDHALWLFSLRRSLMTP